MPPLLTSVILSKVMLSFPISKMEMIEFQPHEVSVRINYNNPRKVFRTGPDSQLTVTECSPPASKQSGKKAASTLPWSVRSSDAPRAPIACPCACNSFLRQSPPLPSTPGGPRVLPQNTNHIPSLTQWWPKNEEGGDTEVALCV